MKILVKVKELAPKIRVTLPSVACACLLVPAITYRPKTAVIYEERTQVRPMIEVLGNQLIRADDKEHWKRHEDAIRNTPDEQVDFMFQSKQFKRARRRIRRNAQSSGKELSETCFRLCRNFLDNRENENLKADILNYCKPKENKKPKVSRIKVRVKREND